MNNQLLLGGVVAGSAVVVTGAVIGVNKVLRAKKAVEDANMEVSILLLFSHSKKLSLTPR